MLVDSERLANEVLARILGDLWRPVTFEECVSTFLGGTIERVRGIVEEESGRRLPEDFESRYHRELFEAFDEGLAAVPGVAPLLDELQTAGTRFCVASSGSRQRIEKTLRQTGLWDRFDGSMFSAEDVPNGKPAPDLFLQAAGWFGSDATGTVVIEDSPLGVQAALAAGMSVVGYAAVTPPERLAGAGAGAVSTTMEDVAALLRAGGPLVARREAKSADL